jgi:hypothetical protein
MRTAFALAVVAACGSSPAPRPPISSGEPPPHVAYATEACVKDFVARQPLAEPRFDVEILRVPREGSADDPHYYVFSVQYGKPQDCPSGCFYSQAFGVALYCDRIGWYGVADYDGIDKSRLTLFRPRPDDTLLYDDTRWPDETLWHLRAFLAKDPNVPDAVRAKAGAPPPKPTIDI